MAVKIKLKRLGKIRAPYYRIVVADARTKRDGRAIEEIGKYHPKAEPSFIEVNSERAQHWLSVGAQPTDPVRKILEITGDWQKFKGLPGAEGTLRTPEERADRKVAFAAALQETLEDGATTSKAKTSRAKSGDSAGAKGARSGKAEKAESGKSEKAESGKTETAKTETAKTETAKGGQSGKSGRSDKGAKAAKSAEDATAEAPAAEAPAAEAPAAEAPAAETAEAPAGDAAGDSASSEG